MTSEPGVEFGDFLRSRRERLTPDRAGLPAGSRRRTPGLRREEVAQLAGIGVDWYIRLEQGKTANPSSATVDALARALRLDPLEASHLRALTHGSARQPFVRETVPDRLCEMVSALNVPAYVTGQRWDVLAWNRPAADLFAFDRIAEDDRNTLLLVLTDPPTRRMFGAGWRDEARRMVAQFRRTFDLWSHDPGFVSLVARLEDGCAEFREWWDAHDLHALRGGEKTIRHPRKGVLTLRYTTFQANDDPRLKLTLCA